MKDSEKKESNVKIVVVDRGILEQLKGGMSPSGEAVSEQPIEARPNNICGLSCKAS